VAESPERPYLLALASAVTAVAVGAGVFVWGSARPEQVLVGRAGRHDAPTADVERHAACLDCHVPFVGTPASRCLGPGCHGELATGSPPKTGPAMPVRFHVALRDEPCELCHAEHDGPVRTASRTFSHTLIPEARRDECRRCHGAGQVAAHSRTDAVGCSTCHGLTRWRDAHLDHSRLSEVHCDSCHDAPETAAHSGLAGTCSTCHGTEVWVPTSSAAVPRPPARPTRPLEARSK
jgi:hypothetical protein